MWQRKQTIYLIALLFLTAIVLWNDVNAIALHALRGGVLTAIDGVVALLAVAAIVGFSRRKRQMTLCRVMEVLLAAWLAYFCFDHYYVGGGAVRYPLYAILPLIGIIVTEMARLGIKHDDDLVRSADRLR